MTYEPSPLLEWACEGLPRRSTDDVRGLVYVLGRLEEAEESQLKSGVREAAAFLKSTRYYLALARAELDSRNAEEA